MNEVTIPGKGENFNEIFKNLAITTQNQITSIQQVSNSIIQVNNSVVQINNNVARIEEKVDRFMDTYNNQQTINYHQRKALRYAVRQAVKNNLTEEQYRDKSKRSTAFSDCYRFLREYGCREPYDETLAKCYDDVIEAVKLWKP